MYLVSKNKLYLDTPLSHIGLEPWDENLNISYFKLNINLVLNGNQFILKINYLLQIVYKIRDS